ncbi:hypothetical protein NC797_14905 [Aquibacillus sp. 3ASR75-11]|uniref:Uncharacterized protein n=1 Tax=Terrihalobacillus insolitus TaxID=2950438 RepID=A0A9X3WU84_9BACI|nr:hypothetical protein [Terrihalobacillus insolitus]MDC3414319.1 hypothetical protein [Terrihalobacillus insolitus]MDC3425795.1 hypothetical protein [Terrihalobacillus insolitus]
MIEFKFASNKLFVLSVVYFMAVIIVSILSGAANGVSNSLFDYVSNNRGGGSASIMPLVLGVLPVIALVLPLMIDQLEKDMIVLRLKHKRKLFYSHFIFSILTSAFFTLVMVLGGIIASFILTGNIDNLWGTKEGTIYFLLDNKAYFPLYIPSVTSVKVWAYIISSRFLATLFIATCVIFLKLILKKNIYVFFVALILFGTDAFFSGRYSLFLGKTRINLETWISPEDQMFNIVYFIFGIVIVYLICLRNYDKKEFYD